MPTLYQAHVATWSRCQRCPLWKTRRNVVLARGVIPAEILLVAEAPGSSENTLGKPMVGPAGKLLDFILEKAGVTQHRYLITNLIACIPIGEEGTKTAEPPPESIKRCAPRLVELVRMAQPRLIVCIGKLAKKHIVGQAQFCAREEAGNPPWLPEGTHLRFCDIIHPAAILRADLTQRALLIQRAIVTLAEALEELR